MRFLLVCINTGKCPKRGEKMEIKELLKAPQLVVVYAITILYTITFYLAAAIEPSTKIHHQRVYQVAKLETGHSVYLEAISDNSSG